MSHGLSLSQYATAMTVVVGARQCKQNSLVLYTMDCLGKPRPAIASKKCMQFYMASCHYRVVLLPADISGRHVRMG
ncbi:hypothetical protein DMX05_24380 [Pseudomonas soli]|nr:hypothetical protein DMX05_24380 [Pseudomonas soli]